MFYYVLSRFTVKMGILRSLSLVSGIEQELPMRPSITGKVEMITGVGKATPPHLTKWGNPNRPIIQSGIFGRYMVSPSNQALFVLNGETRTVNCEIGGLIHPGAIVWFTVSLR